MSLVNSACRNEIRSLPVNAIFPRAERSMTTAEVRAARYWSSENICYPDDDECEPFPDSLLLPACCCFSLQERQRLRLLPGNRSACSSEASRRAAKKSHCWKRPKDTRCV